MVARVTLGLAAFLAGLAGAIAAQAQDVVVRGVVQFSAPEIRRILEHGPWPQPVLRDPSNRVSGNPDAITLGGRLFFDRRLSGDGAMSCAACHVPDRGLTDGLARAYGRAALDRNTPSLWNVGFARWFGWDGAADSLWRQSMKPILNPIELAADANHVADLMRADPAFAMPYVKAFGALPAPGQADDTTLANTGKALAAYLETLVSQRSAFDDFRDALAKGDAVAAARYPVAAQRGLKIFVGKGNCNVCHLGPTFTNGDFGDVGVSHIAGQGRVDSGRLGGLKELASDRFNLLGRYDDDASGAAAAKTRSAALEHRRLGEFKVPGLRNVALTMPYMHDGSLATLRDVVLHYSELDPVRLRADGMPLLQPLHLTPREVDDLVAFLESLTDRSLAVDPGRLHPPQ
jgi:cytochrome c peroxidase